MTALPPHVRGIPGARRLHRQFRLGEWIGAPVTPLFASWLLPGMEDRMHAMFQEMLGQRAPRPYHVIVNGWYFYSLNFVSPAALLRSLPGIIWHLVREPRAVAGCCPPTVRHSFPIMERWWRTTCSRGIGPPSARTKARVETLEIEALPGSGGRIGRCRGRVLHLDRGPGRGGIQDGDEPGRLLSAPSRLPWLAATCRWSPASTAPAGPSRHAVSSLDWWYAPLGQDTVTRHRRRITIRWCGSARPPRQPPRPSWPRRLAGCGSSGGC